MAAITYWPIIFQVYMSFTDYGLRNLRFDAPAANFVGLYQFNVVVPSIANNDLAPVTSSLNGVAGSQTLFLAIKQ